MNERTAAPRHFELRAHTEREVDANILHAENLELIRDTCRALAPREPAEVRLCTHNAHTGTAAPGDGHCERESSSDQEHRASWHPPSFCQVLV